jgi:hypothetical protein
VSDSVTYRWRGPLTDTEMVDLVHAHGGRPARGWWDQIRAYSLGWVTARTPDGALAPFYFDACGFRPTDAGLIHLPSLDD